jgi:carbon-monoxide dehydrogenase large subunit
VFRVAGTDRGIGLLELTRHLRAAPALPEGVPASLDSTGDYDAAELNFPNGCHVCEVEIDPATGQVRVDRYAAVDDVGVAINPMIVHGQVQGGVAQGLGQALMERVAYDAEGQLLSASFMDYALPRATDLPELAVALHEVPARSNPLGVKGVGESGVCGSLAAVMNAVADALARAGARPEIDMPATPEAVWRALQRKEGTS